MLVSLCSWCSSFETAKSISFFPEACAVLWHCLLKKEQCCPQFWSSQSSPWVWTLFCMSLPGTSRKAAVTPKKNGWCCWKSQSGGLSAFCQGICWWRAVLSCVSMLSLIVFKKSSNLFCYFWSTKSLKAVLAVGLEILDESLVFILISHWVWSYQIVHWGWGVLN